jgi:peptidoglycan LD-endopeptidase CwlK
MSEFLKKSIMSLLNEPILKPIVRGTALHLSHVSLFGLTGIDALQPDMRIKCLALMERMKALGKPVHLFEGFRTPHRQDELYAQGRTTSGPIVTNAKALQSAHQYGLGFDLIFEKYNWNPPNYSEWWAVLGEEGRKLGLKWGGEWSDYPHFESSEFDYKLLEQFFKKS